MPGRRTLPPQQSEAAAAALVRFNQRTKLQRRWYHAIVITMLVAVAIGVYVAYRQGEYANTKVHSATVSAPNPPTSAVNAAVHPAWSANQASAAGDPAFDGVVVTYDQHTVYGRELLTGRIIWSYSRSDATMCAVTLQQDKVVIVIRPHSDCDEASAVNTLTGTRAWQRTLVTDSTAITGTPRVFAESQALDVVTPSQVEKLQVSQAPCNLGLGQNCGVDFWSYAPETGCSVTKFLSGAIGDLISESCKGGSNFLILHDPYSSTAPTNIRWRVSVAPDVQPISATGTIEVYNRASSTVEVLNTGSGALSSTEGLSPTPRAAGITGLTSLADGSTIMCLTSACFHVLANGHSDPWTTHPTSQPVLSVSDGELYDQQSGKLARVTPDGTVIQSWAAPPGLTPSLQVAHVASGLLLTGTAAAYLD